VARTSVPVHSVRPSLFLPMAVLLHLGLLAVWTLGSPHRMGASSAVMRALGAWLPAAAVTHRDLQGHRDGSWAVVLYVASIVGAHVAAATREQSR